MNFSHILSSPNQQLNFVSSEVSLLDPKIDLRAGVHCYICNNRKARRQKIVPVIA